MEIKLKTLGFLWAKDRPSVIHRVRVIGISKSAIQFSTPVPENYQASIESFNIILTKEKFLNEWTFENMDEGQTVRVYDATESPYQALGQDVIVEAELVTHDGTTLKTGRRLNNVNIWHVKDQGEAKMLQLAINCLHPAKTTADFARGTVRYAYVDKITVHDLAF